jgi:protein ImuB
MSSNAKILENRFDTAHKPGPLYGCIYIPDYPVQAFIRNEPEIRRQAVAVLDGAFPLFTVVATNAFARRLGVQIGMTKLQLERFADLTVRYRSRDREDSAHRALIDCAHFFTPRVEDTSHDTVTLDLNGLSRLWGTPRAMAQKLFQTADTLGLEAHIAIASNPDAAIHAAKAESGITVIPVGNEAQKLEPLDLRILAPSEEIQTLFSQWGLRTFRDLARLPEVSVAERLGQKGVQLHKMAQGNTARPLHVLNKKPYFKESMKFEDSIDSLEALTFIFSRLIKQLCQRLEARNRATNELRLQLMLEPVPGENKAAAISFIRTIRLPTPTRDSRILLKLLQLDLDGHRPPAPVTQITLTAEPVQPRRVQNGLFVPLTPEPEKLELTLARIGNIVGSKNLGSPELLDTHRPDAFRIHHFIPPNRKTQKGLSRRRSRSIAMRIFRPPLEARVEMLGGQPSRIFFARKSGRITTARGPWNSSGEWWRDQPWKREEWDVEIQTGENHALYRIYQDQYTKQWFVYAMYD